MWLNIRSEDGETDVRPFDGGDVVVGRDGDCDVVIDDERASRRHFHLRFVDGGRLEVEDVGSTNGTWVNGVRVSGPTAVHAGDEIRVGRHALRVTADPLPPGAGTVLAPGGSSPTDPTGAVAPTPAATRPTGATTSGRARNAFGLVGVGGAALLAVVVVVVVVVVLVSTGGSSVRSAQQLVAAWGPSTLYVQTDINGQTQGFGTGWVDNAAEGLIVTNAHVVNGGTSVLVGQGVDQQQGRIVAVSVCDDLAVVRVTDTAGLRPLVLGSQSDVRAGEPTVALGYPTGASSSPQLAVTTGVVSVPETTFSAVGVDAPRYPDMIETSAPINPGNSGGPLLDDHGRLIGVDTAGVTATATGRPLQDEGYAIGVDRLRAVLPRLLAGQSSGYTGMKLVFPTQPSDFASFGLPVEPGAIIVQAADANSPALDTVGPGPYEITAINGRALDGTLQSYCQIVGGLSAGQTAVFHIVGPDGQTEDATIPFE